MQLTFSVKLGNVWQSVPVIDAAFECGLDRLQRLEITCPGSAFDGLPSHIRIDGILAVAVLDYERTNERIRLSGQALNVEALTMTAYLVSDMAGELGTVSAACAALSGLCGAVVDGAPSVPMLKSGWVDGTAQSMFDQLASVLCRARLFYSTDLNNDRVSFNNPFVGGLPAAIISHDRESSIPAYDSCVLTKTAKIAEHKVMTLAPTLPSTNGEFDPQNPPTLLCEKNDLIQYTDTGYITPSSSVQTVTDNFIPAEDGRYRSIENTQFQAPLFYRENFTEYEWRSGTSIITYVYNYNGNAYTYKAQATFKLFVTGFIIEPYNLYKPKIPTAYTADLSYLPYASGSSSGSGNTIPSRADIINGLGFGIGGSNIKPIGNPAVNADPGCMWIIGDGEPVISSVKYECEVQVLQDEIGQFSPDPEYANSWIPAINYLQTIHNDYITISGGASIAKATATFSCTPAGQYPATPDPSDMPYYYLYTRPSQTPKWEWTGNVQEIDSEHWLYRPSGVFPNIMQNMFLQDTAQNIGVVINPYFNAHEIYDANDPNTCFNGPYREQWTDQNRFVGIYGTGNFTFTWQDLPDWVVGFTYDEIALTNATYFASIVAIGMYGTQILDLSSSNASVPLTAAQSGTPAKVIGISPTSETASAQTAGGAKARPYSLSSGLWPSLPSDQDAANMLVFANWKNASETGNAVVPLSAFGIWQDLFRFEWDGARPVAFSLSLAANTVSYSFAYGGQ